ncbi:MAG TPA: YezD family protein [Pseudomonadota bacterium]|nr:YezD family protein [Pseudomonadota bacterium]
MTASRAPELLPPRSESYLRLIPEERAVIEALRELPYGALEVVVHQSRIVQITKTEKVRV